MKTLRTPSRILIVEDEALIAEEIADRLTRLGYEVVADASTADAAFDAAVETAPDLILMDIRLKGGVDGITAAERIRSDRDVPIVFLTAHSDTTTLERAKSTRPFGYVLKPFQERDLMIAIEIALGRHDIERRLRESEARYSTTLRSIGDGVIATDVDHRVTFMNPVAEGLTGWTLDEAGGEPVDRVARMFEESGGRPHPLHEALRLGTIIHVSEALSLEGRHGVTIPVEDSAAPIVDASGELIGAVMAFRDCRPRLEQREALRRVEERLNEALRMEALGRLAGGVAHDFNNMLTIVIGCSELLTEHVQANEPAAVLVQEILAAGFRASSLTDQLLSYSRQRLATPRVVELNALVRGLDDLLRRLVGEDIELTLELCAEPLDFSVEPSQFEQAIVNLAANARDAMGGRGGRLVFRTERVVETSAPDSADGRPPGTYAVLRVEDTGQGMDEGTCARIFEPFFTTKALGRGTGLGLATVHGTVRQFHGHIEVASTPGEGTTFSIFMPIENRAPAEDSAPAAGRTDARGTETILMIEDDPGVSRVLSTGLGSLGYTVLVAADGPAALQAFEDAETVDILVTDVVLPGWNGREVAGLLQARAPELPVLYISGHTDDEVLRRGVEEERIELLRKPFSAGELARRVREILDH